MIQRMGAALRLGCLLAATLTGTLQAAPLPTDGTWAALNVDGNLPPYSLDWTDANGGAAHFSFQVANGFQATLTVVDAGFSGDRFSVFDNGSPLGTTSLGTDGDPNGPSLLDFDAALADAAFSRGVFVLGAGAHDITGTLSTSLADAFGPLNATAGAIRVQVSAVPEPATLSLIGIALMLLLSTLRRVKQRDQA